MTKVNNRSTRTWCEICSKLTIKTSGRRYWLRSGVFIVNVEHISHLILVSIFFDFEQVNVCWKVSYGTLSTPEQNHAIALLSLLSTLNMPYLLPLFIFWVWTFYISIVLRLTLIRLDFLRVVFSGSGQFDPPPFPFIFLEELI